MRTVPLGGKNAAGRVALVDVGDYDLVMTHNWYVILKKQPGRRDSGPYAVASVPCGPYRQAAILMHKLITGYPRTDHINHDGLDNRRANLRPVTGSQNSANARHQQGCTSRYKGVSWHRATLKWAAYIGVRGQQHHLGLFAAEEDAARAYDAVALAAWGEYACLNFPLPQSCA